MQKISLQTARYNVDALIERGRQRVLFSAVLVETCIDYEGATELAGSD